MAGWRSVDGARCDPRILAGIPRPLRCGRTLSSPSGSGAAVGVGAGLSRPTRARECGHDTPGRRARAPTRRRRDPGDRRAAGAGPPPDDAQLRRSRSHRMLAGVAGGIAERFDVDVSLVRVAFVVLACAWGLGRRRVPRDVGARAEWRRRTDEHGATSTPSPSRRRSWLAALLLGGVLVFGLLVATSWWRGPRWGGGVRAPVDRAPWRGRHRRGPTPVAPRRAPRLGRRVARLAAPRRARARLLGVGAVTLAIITTGAFFALVASTGVPFAGGIGDRVYQPASLAQVQPTYRAAIGNLTVDLRRVHFSSEHDPRDRLGRRRRRHRRGAARRRRGRERAQRRRHRRRTAGRPAVVLCGRRHDERGSHGLDAPSARPRRGGRRRAGPARSEGRPREHARRTPSEAAARWNGAGVYPLTYESFSATRPSRTRKTSTPRTWPSAHE